jgi:hypothetical protein
MFSPSRVKLQTLPSGLARSQIRRFQLQPKPQKARRFTLSIWEPIPEKLIKRYEQHPNRASAFNPDKPTPVSHREYADEDGWEATFWNGSIPILLVVAVLWGLSEKWMRTLPVPNDGEFGPMRYANNPDAKYWGNYRRDIQPRKGRRHWDKGI